MSLDLNNLTPDERTFYDTLESAGMPISDEALRAEFASMADDAELTITNNSAYSPFWCFVTAAVVNPTKWLTAFIIRRIMPGLYVKTSSGALLDILAWSYGIERKPAAVTQGYITFSRPVGDPATTPLEIPAETIVRSVPVAGISYQMITQDIAVIPAGENSVRALAVATAPGGAYNLGTSYYSIIDGGNASRFTAINESDYLISPGADEESDNELRMRLRNHYTAVSDWHTDAKYKAMISTLTGFRVDRLFFVHDAPRGPGTADCYALFDADADPSEYLIDVNEYIMEQGNHGHGDDLVVQALPSKFYGIRLQVVLRSSLTVDVRADALNKIETLIRCAFRQNTAYNETVTQTWPFSSFSFSRLDHELHELFTAIVSLSWEYRAITQDELDNNEFDTNVDTWQKGDIPSELDVPRLFKLIINEVV